MKTMYSFCLTMILFFSSNIFAYEREIAITIDDLPLVGSRMNTPGNQQRATERFMRIIKALKDYNAPAVGFVIAGAIDKGQWEFLEEFRDAGFIIGNHTYSHGNLNAMNAEKYIGDLDRADKKLAPLFSEKKYFRYPYLAEGRRETKQKVLNYLQENNYVIAPVTIDSKDFRFNEEVYRIPFAQREQYIYNKMRPRYLGYIWKQTLKAESQANGKPTKQILLIHANLLNSYLLEDILKMYQENGYKFISLEEALKNPAPPIEVSANKDLSEQSEVVEHNERNNNT